VPKAGRMNGRILLTGAAGFIGRAVCTGLRSRGNRPARLLLHRRGADEAWTAGFEVVWGDLGCPESLGNLCEDVETVLHSATYIGEDHALLEAVNVRGTEALVLAARAAGVRTFVYVSTAAVYGYAVHRGAQETQVRVDPATPISRSRAGAEQAVLGYGGVVIRPLFVYGHGDTRFLPAVIRTLERFPFMIDGGRARLSVISVDDLAAALIALADGGGLSPRPGVYHATDGQPVRFRDIAAALSKELGLRRPRFSLPLSLARRILRSPRRTAFPDADRASRAHRLFLIAKDHYYDSTRLWELLGTKPGPPLPEQLPAYAEWYRQFLTSRAGEGRR
jgi:nucleoside-diphosphate-sugar epimerase